MIASMILSASALVGSVIFASDAVEIFGKGCSTEGGGGNGARKGNSTDNLGAFFFGFVWREETTEL